MLLQTSLLQQLLQIIKFNLQLRRINYRLFDFKNLGTSRLNEAISRIVVLLLSLFLWSPYGIGQTVIFLPCGFFFFLSFFLSFLFLAESQPSQIGCLPYFHTWCGLSANLGCRSETCCTRLAENTGRKKVAKNRHLGTIAQLCRAISSQLMPMTHAPETGARNRHQKTGVGFWRVCHTIWCRIFPAPDSGVG